MGLEVFFTPESPEPGMYSGIISPKLQTKQPARMVREGIRLANAMHRALTSATDGGDGAEQKTFNSTFSRLTDTEKAALNRPADPLRSGCLSCDCHAKTSCRLRRHASEYGIRNPRYTKTSVREALQCLDAGSGMVFEPAKCIRCGLCVYNSRNGFTFKGRGFVMETVLPAENAANVTERLAELCPTGALYTVRE
jgi:predicted molibdopterin-dependent oxidoreductase YjgC